MAPLPCRRDSVREGVVQHGHTRDDGRGHAPARPHHQSLKLLMPSCLSFVWDGDTCNASLMPMLMK